MAAVLSLDLGSSSARAVPYDEEARELGPGASRRYELGPDGELDPGELLAACRAVVDEAGSGEPIAVSAFWHSLVALDARDRPLTPVLGWRDTRAGGEAEWLRATLDAEAVWRRTGCPLHASFWPAKLAWLRAGHPDVFARAARFVSFADWLVLEETGELRTSPSLASGTGLYAGEAWDPELLDVLGISEAQLPPVSLEQAGRWHAPLGDGAAANLGVDAWAPRAAVTIGTSAAIRVLETGERRPPAGLFRYLLDPGRHVVGGSMSDGGNLVERLGTLVGVSPAEVADASPADGPLLLPLFGGERSPGWNAEARGALAGLSLDTTGADLVRAAMQGVALWLAELAERVGGIREVVATGGALRESPVWQGFLADALGVDVLPSLEREASARGAAAWVIARSGGTPAPARVGEPIAARPERADAYRSARASQRNLYLGVT